MRTLLGDLFHCYIPVFFWKENTILFSNNSGEAFTSGLCNKNQTEPNCTIVKVEVDLLSEFLKG